MSLGKSGRLIKCWFLLNIPKLHSAKDLGAQMKYNNVIGADLYFKREKVVLAKLAKIKS